MTIKQIKELSKRMKEEEERLTAEQYLFLHALKKYEQMEDRAAQLRGEHAALNQKREELRLANLEWKKNYNMLQVQLLEHKQKQQQMERDILAQSQAVLRKQWLLSKTNFRICS